MKSVLSEFMLETNASCSLSKKLLLSSGEGIIALEPL